MESLTITVSVSESELRGDVPITLGKGNFYVYFGFRVWILTSMLIIFVQGVRLISSWIPVLKKWYGKNVSGSRQDLGFVGVFSILKKLSRS